MQLNTDNSLFQQSWAKGLWPYSTLQHTSAYGKKQYLVSSLKCVNPVSLWQNWTIFVFNSPSQSPLESASMLSALLSDSLHQLENSSTSTFSNISTIWFHYILWFGYPLYVSYQGVQKTNQQKVMAKLTFLKALWLRWLMLSCDEEEQISMIT